MLLIEKIDSNFFGIRTNMFFFSCFHQKKNQQGKEKNQQEKEKNQQEKEKNQQEKEKNRVQITNGMMVFY